MQKLREESERKSKRDEEEKLELEAKNRELEETNKKLLEDKDREVLATTEEEEEVNTKIGKTRKFLSNITNWIF